MQTNNSRGVASKRKWVWGDEFSLIRADNVPKKRSLVLEWETLYMHNADRKHHPTKQHMCNKGACWALLPFREVILCSHSCHAVSLTKKGSGPCLRPASPTQLSADLCSWRSREDLPRACKNQMERCTELQVPVSFPSLVFLTPLIAMSRYSQSSPISA